MTNTKPNESNQEPTLYPTTGPMMSRRNVLRAGAAAGAATTLPVGASHVGYSPIGTAQAAPPLIGAAWVAAKAAGAKVGAWMTGTKAGVATGAGASALAGSLLGRWTAPEGEDEAVYHDMAYQQAIQRAHEYQTTLIDTRDEIPRLVEAGRSEAAWETMVSIATGGTEGDATAAATSGVNSVFAGAQKTLLIAQEHHIEFAVSVAEQGDKIGARQIIWHHSNARASYDDFLDLGTEEVTLADGSQMEVTEHISSSGGSVSSGVMNYIPGVSHSASKRALEIESPYTDERAEVWNAAMASELWNDIDEARQEALESVSDVVSDVYSAIDSGELDEHDIDPTDFIGPHEGSSRTALSWTETNSSLYRLMSAAAMGYQVSDIETTLTAEYVPHDADKDDSQTLVGGLVGELDADDVTVGDVIDTTDDEGEAEKALWFMALDGDSVDAVQILGTLEIMEMRDMDGEDVDSMETWSYDLARISDTSADLDALREDLERFRELVEAAEAEADDEGGGGGFGGAGTNLALFGVAVLAGAAALLGLRDDEGDSGGGGYSPPRY